jgi:hypothetical protein
MDPRHTQIRSRRSEYRSHSVDRSSNGSVGELTLVRRQHLPDPPHAINIGVVKVESRVTRAGEDVVAWITTEGVVPTAVDADLELRG